MKKTSSELKRLAREKLNGNWGFVISTFLVAVLIPALCMLPFTLTLPEHPSTSQQAIYNMASFIPPATPKSASRASPGPFTAHPITAT